MIGIGSGAEEAAIDAGNIAAVGEDETGGWGSRNIELAEGRVGDEVFEGGADGGAANEGPRRKLEEDITEYVKWEFQDVEP